jgi:Flp pilus assembly protein TadG
MSREQTMMRNGVAGTRRRERGSMAVEMVLLTPAFVLLMLFLVGVGRVVEAQGQADGAARDAARAASIQRQVALVPTAVNQAAATDLVQAGKDMCPDGMHTGWHGSSAAGSVTVTVQCSINLAVVPGLGSIPVTGQAVAPLDTYMERDW